MRRVQSRPHHMARHLQAKLPSTGRVWRGPVSLYDVTVLLFLPLRRALAYSDLAATAANGLCILFIHSFGSLLA